jgi:hypothetical protein
VSKPVTFESSVERYSGSVLGRDTKSRVIVNQTYVGQNGIGKEFGNVWSSPIMNMTRSDIEIVREEADKVMALHMQSPPVFGKSDFRALLGALQPRQRQQPNSLINQITTTLLNMSKRLLTTRK